MRLKRNLIYFLILLFTIVILFIVQIFLKSIEKTKYMKLTDANREKISSIFKCLNIYTTNNIESVSISPKLTDPEDYILNVTYNTGENETYELYTSSIRNDFNPIIKSIDYISKFGYLIESSNKYELQINEENINEIFSIINYFNINDIQALDTLILSIDSHEYNISIRYLNGSNEYSIFQGSITDYDMNLHNPILNAIEYIETNCDNCNKLNHYIELRNILKIIILIEIMLLLFSIYCTVKKNRLM